MLGSDSRRASSQGPLPRGRGSVWRTPTLDREGRAAVLAALRGHCAHRGWCLLANHVHAIVEADVRPEKVSREFNRLDRDGPDRKRWARHGSAGWLWKDEDLQQALQYVVEDQGEPMALFIGGNIIKNIHSLAVAARLKP